MPAMIALFRFLSQTCPCVSGNMAIESNKRTKKETDQNGRILPKFSMTPLSDVVIDDQPNITKKKIFAQHLNALCPLRLWNPHGLKPVTPLYASFGGTLRSIPHHARMNLGGENPFFVWLLSGFLERMPGRHRDEPSLLNNGRVRLGRIHPIFWISISLPITTKISLSLITKSARGTMVSRSGNTSLMAITSMWCLALRWRSPIVLP